ncbi:hypothetical protein HPB50_002941 [Hyalomma asiaticum]|uniref:Uncharacterized protein n=1 Tax=Hyalomma asiaticum TaxID=266040 RepID=A0ACB7T5Q1_HYAAI|nr:hypothetical protein HPB50_002941 [Hyalomma asiaticum]
MLPPCTATPENTCQIVDHLSTLNEFLSYAELELRELPTPRGEVTLASFADRTHYVPHSSEKTFKHAIALVLGLLKTHECIQHVQLHSGILAAHVATICEALRWNLSRIRTLRFDCGIILSNNCNTYPYDTTYPVEGLGQTEERSYNDLAYGLSILIQHSSTLTTLEMAELRMNGETATAFVSALSENCTLEELSIHGSVVCKSEEDQFVRYLRVTVSLTAISITADDARNRNCFKRTAQGLLVNNTVRNVRLNNIRFDPYNAALAAEVFNENKSIRSFEILYTPHTLAAIPSTDYGYWLEPLSSNETLEELGLPFSIWKPEQWLVFFSSLSRKQSLKKLTVALHATDNRYLPALCAALHENGAEEKVSLGTYFVRHNLNLVYSKAFSDVDVFCFGNIAGRLSQELLAFAHVTSVRFTLRMGDVSFASAVAAYIGATSSLRKLRLSMHTDDDDPPQYATDSWSLIVESLSRNRSVRELGLHVDFEVNDEDDDWANGIKQHQLERLGRVVRTSVNVRRLHFHAEDASEVAIFLRSFSEDIAANCSLIRVFVSGALDKEAAQNYYNARETASRNYSLVTRAEQFARGRYSEQLSGTRLNLVPVAELIADRWCRRLLEEHEECSPELDGSIRRRGIRNVRREQGQGVPGLWWPGHEA